MGISKQDWKLFRERISVWQESYMEKLNKEYIELLTGNGTPSEKFRKNFGVWKNASGMTKDIRAC